jgi:hypothetical protein
MVRKPLEPVWGFPDHCTYINYTFSTTNGSKWVETVKDVPYSGTLNSGSRNIFRVSCNLVTGAYYAYLQGSSIYSIGIFKIFVFKCTKLFKSFAPFSNKIPSLPSVNHHHQRPLELHLLPQFLSHQNHPNLMSNFHHHHFQNIQGMHQYDFMTEQQDILSKYQPPPQFLQHQEEQGVDHPRVDLL